MNTTLTMFDLIVTILIMIWCWDIGKWLGRCVSRRCRKKAVRDSIKPYYDQYSDLTPNQWRELHGLEPVLRSYEMENHKEHVRTLTEAQWKNLNEWLNQCEDKFPENIRKIMEEFKDE